MDFFQRFIEVVYPFNRDRQCVGRNIVSKQPAVSIIDQPPRGWDWLNLYPVLVRKRGIDLMLDNLQVEQPAYQHERQQQYQTKSNHGAREEDLALAGMIL